MNFGWLLTVYYTIPHGDIVSIQIEILVENIGFELLSKRRIMELWEPKWNVGLCCHASEIRMCND